MEIKTKYNPGDVLWYKRYDGTVDKSIVLRILVYDDCHLYDLMFEEQEFKECELFSTEEELLASLK